MLCQRFLPCPSMRPYIAWYWTLEQTNVEASSIRYRLIPDAHVDWVFHLQEPWYYNFTTGKEVEEKYQAHLFGHCTRFIELKVSPGVLQVFGIKFHPWAASLFWNIQMDDATDQEVALDDLPIKGIASFIEGIIGAADTEARIKHSEDFLSEQITNFDSLKGVVQLLSGNNLDSISSMHNRRLQQRFKNEIGISLKTYQRTMRINRVIEEMRSKATKLTDIAYQYGYFDQSHFNRDFQKFTGLNPKKFINSIDPSEDFLNLRIG